MIAGVCGGLAEHFRIDPTIVRIVWVAASIALGAGFPGLIAYIIAAIVIPEEKVNSYEGDHKDGYKVDEELKNLNKDMDEWREPVKVDSGRTGLVIGVALVAIGGLIIARQVLQSIDTTFFWPLILIIAGGLIIFKASKRQQ